MEIRILAFGIAKDIIKKANLKLEVENGSTVGELRNSLERQYPDFSKLASLRFAVNSDYVQDDYLLEKGDEVVLIPPVSGG
ncbi:MAG: molybdopterin converting factor subunit 1 [Bacteroidota bacterium]